MKLSKKELKLFNASQSPLFSLILLLLLSFSLMGLDYRKGIHQDIKQKSTFLILPLIYVLNLPNDISKSLEDLFKEKSILSEKNKELENKIIDLSIEIQRLNFIKAENSQLRKTIKITNSLGINSISADIILPKINNGKKLIVINKGFKDGIKIGHPVINNTGLIGQIIFIASTYSEINPITSKKYMVPAIFEKAVDNLIVRGNGSEYLEVSMFPAHRKVIIGAVLVTSGIDGTYPKGIKIGRIIKISPQANNQFNHLLIAPYSGPKSHSQVRVFLGKSK